MDTTVDDSYRDCVKTLQFLNLGIEFNTHGLCKFHDVKDGRFLDFMTLTIPCLLIPLILDWCRSIVALLLQLNLSRGLMVWMPGKLNSLQVLFLFCKLVNHL
jgi:hypothetical protein